MRGAWRPGCRERLLKLFVELVDGLGQRRFLGELVIQPLQEIAAVRFQSWNHSIGVIFRSLKTWNSKRVATAGGDRHAGEIALSGRGSP